MSSSPIPPHVYETTNLATTEYPQFARPATPTRSPFKESSPYRRSPAKVTRPTKTAPDVVEFHKLLRDDRTTTGEKDLASRVVKAAEKLREWCNEIEQWGWSGSFGTPTRSDMESSKSLDQAGTPDEAGDYYGSLPRDQVEAYESRLDEIDTELTALEIDELKEHVLSLHKGRSRPSSSYSTQSMSTLTFMDDFQLFVTETIMQTLPLLAKLKQYSRAWSLRLEILVKVPLFLDDLAALGDDLKKAYSPLRFTLGPSMAPVDAQKLKETLETLQDTLKDRVGELGKLLDIMLDILEGSEDKLPDYWIDRFEKHEKEYTDWSYFAEKKLFDLHMLEADVAREEGCPLVPTSPLDPAEEAASDHSPELAQAGTAISMVDREEVATVAGASSTEQSDNAISAEVAEIDDSASTTIHYPAKLESSSTFPALLEPVTEYQVDTALQNPRNSTSTAASIQVPGPRSNHSSPPASPVDGHNRPISWETQASTPQSAAKEQRKPVTEGMSPQTPRTESAGRRDSVSSIASGSSAASDLNEDDSPSMRASTRYMAHVPRPPLNYAMRKRRKDDPLKDTTRTFSIPFSDIESRSTNVSAPESPTKTSSKSSRSPKSPTMPLEEQISNILETIPAPIRLRSGPSPNAPEVKRKHKHTPQQTRNRATTPLPTLTLAPADEVSGRKPGGNDPEIKVYHLSQAGLAKPIKLFVRRVGENGERVMVRVGGGWADLGEYLRSYADHHGRRTASDGRVEVLGLSNVPDTRAGAITPTSRRSSLVSSIGSSAMAGTTGITDSRSPIPSLAVNITSHQGDENTPLSTSPRSALVGSASSRRSSSMPWDGTDVSLAGPAHRPSKMGDMSEEKKQWVEGIVEQAKATVPGRKVEFGDLGKKGGTRRVFLKGGAVE